MYYVHVSISAFKSVVFNFFFNRPLQELCLIIGPPTYWFGAREIVCPLRYVPDCVVLGWNLA